MINLTYLVDDPVSNTIPPALRAAMDTEEVHEEDCTVGCPSDSVSHECLRVNSCSS